MYVKTEEFDKNIIDLYNDGLSKRAISRQLEVATTTVTRVLRTYGIKERTKVSNIDRSNFVSKKVPESEFDNIIRLYEEGLCQREIASIYNISVPTLIKIMKYCAPNIQKHTRSSSFSSDDIKKMSEMYDAGYSLSSIGSIYNVDKTEIAFLFKKINKQLRDASHARKQYELNENYFDNIDTQEKAYILGLLYADGCNYVKNHSVQISLQERDKHILERIKQELNTNVPLYFEERRSKNKNHQNAYVLKINSKYMSNKLNELGMRPRKSLILEFPEWLDKNLYSHFIRGYFDGDGHVSGISGVHCIEIVSTNNFCLKIQEILNGEGIPSRITNTYNKETTTMVLKITKKSDVIRFLDYIYNGSTICLNRKRDIYESKYCNNINDTVSA